MLTLRAVQCRPVQIYVEVERARITRMLASIKEQEGKINEASEVLQEVRTGAQVLVHHHDAASCAHPGRPRTVIMHERRRRTTQRNAPRNVNYELVTVILAL